VGFRIKLNYEKVPRPSKLSRDGFDGRILPSALREFETFSKELSKPKNRQTLNALNVGGERSRK